jgi:hypothetical protein
MSLTATDYQSLKRVGLTKFFTDNRAMYLALAKEAYGYAKKCVGPTGQNVRPDDVAPLLLQALELNDKLTNWLAGKRLTQQYWYKRFGDLVIDDTWKELP